MLVALFSFAGMGIIHKIGDRYTCNPLHIALFTMGSAGLFSLIYTFLAQPGALHEWKATVPLIALPFGACASAALWLFQRGLRYGRIATSWLLINLSAGISTCLSVVLYHEPLSPRKAGVLLLIVVSLMLLWWDRKQERPKDEQEVVKTLAGPIGGVD